MTESKNPHPLKQRLGGRNLYLIGMMGSGKSSSGKPLAEQLGYGFIDADKVIEELLGQSIQTIFADQGEEQFREIETQVLQSIGQRHSLIVATGGGVVTRPTNWGVLHQGIVIWLDANPRQILTRLKSDPNQRPLLSEKTKEETFYSLLKKRQAFYSEADLHLSVETETPEEVATMIMEKLPSIIRTPEDPAAPQTTSR